jgi:hypothetical protein
MIKRLLFLLGVVVLLGGVLVLFTYDLIKVDWISFMEIQPSFKPMEHPLPVAVDGGACQPCSCRSSFSGARGAALQDQLPDLPWAGWQRGWSNRRFLPIQTSQSDLPHSPKSE